MSPPTRREYSACHAGLPKDSPPLSPVSVWSSLAPKVSTTAFGRSAGSTCSRYAGQLKTSGRASPVEMWESTGPTTPTAPVAIGLVDERWPGTSERESPPIQRRSSARAVNVCRGGRVVGVGPAVVVGLGRWVSTWSSLLRPSRSLKPCRSRSMYSAWLTS